MDREERLEKLLHRARKLAREYYELTGRPLGVTGEVGEYWAAKHLGVRLSAARMAGYDALDRSRRRVQIKARVIFTGNKKSQRIGRINLSHRFDAVILVLLNEAYEPLQMYRADRKAVEQALLAPGSTARNEKGALAVSKFKSIGKLIWTHQSSLRQTGNRTSHALRP